MANKKRLKVKFLLSPTAVFGLGYNAGDVALLPEPLAYELVENKYAKFLKKEKLVPENIMVVDPVVIGPLVGAVKTAETETEDKK